MCLSDYRSFCKNAEQTAAIEPRLLTECYGLGNRLHSNSEQSVHDKLHNRTRAAWPQ